MDGHAYHLGKKITTCVISFFVLIFSYNSVNADTMIIDDMENSNGSAEKRDYCEETTTKWCFVTDKVMGVLI